MQPISILRRLFSHIDTSVRADAPAPPVIVTEFDPAHLLLLSRFVSPQRSDERWGDQWDEALGEPVGRAIERFRDEGLIEEASVEEKLTCFHTAASLRSTLKAAGLPGKGSKIELSRRLADERRDKAAEVVAAIAALRCSKRGRILAEAAIENYRMVRSTAERAAVDALTRGDLAGAARAVVSFEARQVFPRGVNIQWDEGEVVRLARDLRYLYEGRPTILRNMSGEVIQALRPAAAMMLLWGEARLRGKLETGIRLPSDVAARMLVFSVNARRNLEQMRQSAVVKRVGILAADDSCNECKRLARREYRLASAPELPHPDCAHAMGCRCCYVPQI